MLFNIMSSKEGALSTSTQIVSTQWCHGGHALLSFLGPGSIATLPYKCTNYPGILLKRSILMENQIDRAGNMLKQWDIWTSHSLCIIIAGIVPELDDVKSMLTLPLVRLYPLTCVDCICLLPAVFACVCLDSAFSLHLTTTCLKIC